MLFRSERKTVALNKDCKPSLSLYLKDLSSCSVVEPESPGQVCIASKRTVKVPDPIAPPVSGAPHPKYAYSPLPKPHYRRTGTLTLPEGFMPGDPVGLRLEAAKECCCFVTIVHSVEGDQVTVKYIFWNGEPMTTTLPLSSVFHVLVSVSLENRSEEHTSEHHAHSEIW